MATKSKVAILDSSAIISLVNVADSLHDEAVRVDELILTEGWLTLLPREVFAETLNAIGKKISRRDAVRVGRLIMERYDAHDFEFTHPERHVYDTALKLQAEGAGSPSFIDCLVMALADEYDTRYVVGFDATFSKNGYWLPGAR
jgi:predicted nucleic acid-binding protein